MSLFCSNPTCDYELPPDPSVAWPWACPQCGGTSFKGPVKYSTAIASGAACPPMERLYTEAEVRERERAARLDEAKWLKEHLWLDPMPIPSTRLWQRIAELQAEQEKRDG